MTDALCAELGLSILCLTSQLSELLPSYHLPNVYRDSVSKFLLDEAAEEYKEMDVESAFPFS
jgi:hypothetical protein